MDFSKEEKEDFGCICKMKSSSNLTDEVHHLPHQQIRRSTRSRDHVRHIHAYSMIVIYVSLCTVMTTSNMLKLSDLR